MTAILSPQPRRGSLSPQPAVDRPALPLSPPIYPSKDLSRSTGLFSPPRLLSPINIAGPGLNQPKLSKSAGTCNTIKRRRTTTNTIRTSRRRHCSRADCSPALTSSIFDHLPWISQVESPPERVDVWNIADLSLLPDSLEKQLGSGVGPVRRRKTSLRSSLSDATTHPHRSSSPLLLPQPVLDRMGPDPRTPPPSTTLNPMEVTFRNLMPVFPSQDKELALSPRIPAWSLPSSPIRR
ncbi:hypothetical protein BDY19DRAFT_294147 [Irpex rosettiformis]|uniref:Uncharacterized protein n=1 Tax=Irpex rosettiformis TaxID=378272 RepID=A0ACB8UIH0_9APHY|nr:hypothetical protein BDY19DRAFT_294147 [Irpex rosettiformis]